MSVSLFKKQHTMQRYSIIKLAGASALLLLLVGCSGGRASSDNGSALLDAPNSVAAVYRAQCISCHGTDLQGRVGANTNLQQVGSRMDVAAITKQIEEGEGVMRSFKDVLTDEEIHGLANWLANKK